MAFVLETAIVKLQSDGFAAFKKQTDAIDKSLSGIGKQITGIDKASEALSHQSRSMQAYASAVEKMQGSLRVSPEVSTAFAKQTTLAGNFSTALAKIPRQFNDATDAATRFFKRTASGFRDIDATINLAPTRTSTFERLRMNAMNASRSGTVNTDYRLQNLTKDAGETESAFRGIFKNTGIEDLNRDLKTLGDKLSEVNREAKKLRTTFREVTSAVDKFEHETRSATRSARAQFQQLERSARAFGDSFGESFGESFGGANNNFKNVRYQTLHAGYALKHLQQPIKAVVQGFIDVGTSVVGGLGPVALAASTASLALVGLTRVIGSAVSQSADLEKSLAEVATISPEVAGEITKFADILGDLSVSTRTDVGLLSEGLYQTISSGITDTADALKFLETSALSARAGLTSVDVAVDGLSSVINAFGMDASEVGLIADKFFKTVEVGKLRFEDLARNIGKVAPLATTLGVSLDELLAAGAALTTGGNTLSVSFTALSGVMNAVLRPSQKALTLSKELGLEFSVAALKAKGLAGFLRDLQEQTGGSEEMMGQLFGRVEGLKGVLALTGAQADAFTKNLESIGMAAGATDKAVAIMNDTLHGQIDLLKVQINNALRTLGNELLPTVTQGAEALNKALSDVDWDAFRQGVQDTIAELKFLFEWGNKVRKVMSVVVPSMAPLTTINRVRGAVDTGRNVLPGVGAGPNARTSLATGEVPTLMNENSPEAEFDRNAVRDIAVAFAKTDQLTTEQVGILTDISKNTNELITALKQSGITKEGLAEAIVAAIPKETEITTQTTPAAVPTLQRAIPLTEAEEKARDKILSDVTPKLSPRAPGERRLPEVNREAQARVESAPQGIDNINIEAMTDAPIPGVQGQLIDPALGIQFQDGVAAFSEAAGNLDMTAPDAVSDSTPALQFAEQFPEAQASLDAMAEAERMDERQAPELPRMFGTQAEEAARVEMPEIETEMTGFTDVLKGAGKQLAGNFSLVSAAIEGGSAGGVPGAIAAVGLELLQMTPSFGKIQESWNKVVGQLVMAIEPVVAVLAEALEPAFDALSEVVKALEPFFQILGAILRVTVVPAMKILGKVVGLLAKGIQTVWNFIIKSINAVIGLINKIPFVNIGKIPEAGANEQVPDTTINAEEESPAAARAANRGGDAATDRASGGISISNITGETRDIFVDLLKPLRNLNTTFPEMLSELKGIHLTLKGKMAVARAEMLPTMDMPDMPVGSQATLMLMLDELEMINDTLTDMRAPRAVGGFVANQPNLSGGLFAGNNIQDAQQGFGQQGFIGQGGNPIVVQGDIVVNVDQVSDLDPDELKRRIERSLDLQRRAAGEVFPINRNRANAFVQ